MSLAERKGARPNEHDEQVAIDRSKTSDRYRYACPNGHVNWSRTNCHLWCKQCRRRIEAGDESIDAEHYEILDKRENTLIPWEQVRLG